MRPHTPARWLVLPLVLVLLLSAAGIPAAPVAVAAPDAGDAALVRASLRHPIQDSVFYFVLPDRFNNGSTANDTGGIAGDETAHGFRPQEKGYYHGGDLAGLRAKLPYLAELGVGAIWMTPLFKNKPLQDDSSSLHGLSAGYHGYWITDFTTIDPHFGTNQELADLIADAHSRGMKVFFDIITNHTADVIRYEGAETSYRSKADFPYRDAGGNVFDDADYAGGDTFPALDANTSFPYKPQVPSAEANVKKPNWLNNPIYYHNRGDTTYSGENSTYGDFIKSLDDLFTEHPVVVDGMTEIYKTWIADLGVDGFRIDTVKHVNIEFWQQFGPEIMEYARANGKPDFFMFGEIFDGDPAFKSVYTTEGRLPAALDFGFQGNARAFASQGAATNALRDFFAKDDYYTDADSNAYSLPTFLGNHDMGRVGLFLTEDNAAADDAELLARSKLAHALMFTARGMPVIYYGDEQGFVGDGGDKDARQDMMPSQVPSYNDDDLIGTAKTTADDNFDTAHPLFMALKELAEVRADHAALRQGAQIHRYSDAAAGVYAFSRIDRDERVEYVVALNNAETSKSAVVQTFSPGMAFAPVYPAGGAVLTSDAAGALALDVPALGFAIYRAASPLASAAPAPAVALDKPAPGAQALGRIEVAASLDRARFAEVTFAVKVGDAADYTVIGTDDNAPYRVFYDVSGIPAGTALTFKAIVNDLSDDDGSNVGALDSAEVSVTRGDDRGDNPDSVTIAGSLQSELGCPGDWQPECERTFLAYDQADDVWQGSFAVPSGAWEYKAALNGSWSENYGASARRDGPNIGLNLAAAGQVKFYYDHKTHWVTSNKNVPIATAPGNYQSELGCPGDWQPDCLRSWLQDPDGDGVYTFTTNKLPAGNYEVKVAIDEGWAENYGQGGARDGANIPFTVPSDGATVSFSWSATTKVLTVADGAARGNIGRAAAHWLARDTIAWNVAGDASTFRLHTAAGGGLALTPDGVIGGEVIALTRDPAGLSDALKARFPHLKDYAAFKIAVADLAKVPAALKGQLAVDALNGGGDVVDATGVQIPGVLDDLYAYTGELGVSWSGGTPTLRVWAPTARAVKLHLFGSSTATTGAVLPMTLDAATGVWSVSGTGAWRNRFYLYEVEVYVPSTGKVERNLVTDPYSLSLATNSRRSQIVNLNDAALKPSGWDSQRIPPLDAPEDIVLYELHVRDFSANDPTVPEPMRGTFNAFQVTSSDGMRHLRKLANAGLTHIHLLPAFDCASIDEDKSTWETPDPALLATFPPNSEEQAKLVEAARDKDGFNWCYDPFHYTVPEGSYAQNTDGYSRVWEFRAMVRALHRSGLRVVMDVVYNHTAQSGQGEKSVLDKVVPGYYHRLNATTGAVETSTCCQNTATEHAMMRKLMVDSVLTWARAYKVTGFRFDLMGHHMKADMLAVRSALDSLTVAKDGVDGRSIYLYGEGWNFGEVANNARGVNATQLNMAGTGIGTFSDRLRDAVRGGGPFDGGQDKKRQGFINGLSYDPNGLNQGSEAQQRDRLLLYQDQIKVGLAGNLADYELVDRNGATVKGSQVDYNGSPAGYTRDPQEVVTYIEAHDNETLFDKIQYAAPVARTVAERVRMQNMGISVVMLGQGVPFFQAGQDLLRSKSFDRNSYNSGDWFNRLDWSYQSNNWGVGLPPNESRADWGVMRDLLGNPALTPQPSDIVDAATHFQEMLRIRKSSPLFRLRTAEQVKQRVFFLNSGPDQVAGLIVMCIDDQGGPDLDPGAEGVCVLFNANDQDLTYRDTRLAGLRLRLHPVQLGSADPLVRTSTYNLATGTFTVPARTTAVFVLR